MALQEPVAQVEDHLGGPAQRDDLKGMFVHCAAAGRARVEVWRRGTGCEKFCV